MAHKILRVGWSKTLVMKIPKEEKTQQKLRPGRLMAQCSLLIDSIKTEIFASVEFFVGFFFTSHFSSYTI